MYVPYGRAGYRSHSPGGGAKDTSGQTTVWLHAYIADECGFEDDVLGAHYCSLGCECFSALLYGVQL